MTMELLTCIVLVVLLGSFLCKCCSACLTCTNPSSPYPTRRNSPGVSFINVSAPEVDGSHCRAPSSFQLNRAHFGEGSSVSPGIAVLTAPVHYGPPELKEVDCEQEQLGSWVHLHCPPGHEPTLGYCCNYNGKISCCSYGDYSLMHGHGAEAVICLIVTGSLTVVILVVLFYMRCRDKGIAEANMENSQESDNRPIPTIVVSPAESMQNTVHSRQSLQNTIQSTQSWSSCRYAEVLQNIFREDEESEKKSSAGKKVSFAGVYV